MKKFLMIIGCVLIILGFYGWGDGWLSFGPKTEKIEVKNTPKPTPTPVPKNIGYMAQYNFENLKKKINVGSEIKTIGEVLTVKEARKALVKRGDLAGKTFNFTSKAISFESNGKDISGMINYPVGYENKKSPVIIMIRGFADNEGYYIGSGSWRAADELARNGFVTVSLDFLGFGLSDDESKDILEARFEKPENVLDLIESVKKLDFVDPEKIGIWAHSNGGQIAISVLEVTGENYPTVLWAPMTNPFPASVLDSMDETTEAGQIVKNRIDKTKLAKLPNSFGFCKYKANSIMSAIVGATVSVRIILANFSIIIISSFRYRIFYLQQKTTPLCRDQCVYL